MLKVIDELVKLFITFATLLNLNKIYSFLGFFSDWILNFDFSHPVTCCKSVTLLFMQLFFQFIS